MSRRFSQKASSIGRDEVWVWREPKDLLRLLGGDLATYSRFFGIGCWLKGSFNLGSFKLFSGLGSHTAGDSS